MEFTSSFFEKFPKKPFDMIAYFLEICSFLISHPCYLKSSSKRNNLYIGKFFHDSEYHASDFFPDFRIRSGSDMCMELSDGETIFSGNLLDLLEILMPDTKT